MIDRNFKISSAIPNLKNKNLSKIQIIQTFIDRSLKLYYKMKMKIDNFHSIIGFNSQDKKTKLIRRANRPHINVENVGRDNQHKN
jgi:hypothetical protein